MSLQLFLMVRIILIFLLIICYNKCVLSEGYKNYFNNQCLNNLEPPILTFTSFLFLWFDRILALIGRSCILCDKRNSFCIGLSLRNSEKSYLFSTGVTSFGVLFLFLPSITRVLFVYSFWSYFRWHRWGSLKQHIS